jgi:hypothetical protein
MSRADQNYILLSNSERVFEQEQTLEELQPGLYKDILDYAHRLKEIFRNNQQFEFTVELGKVWITQSSDDVVKDDYPEFMDLPDLQPISRGHGVSGGAFRGWVANSFEAAEELLEQYERERPQDVDGVVLFLDRVNPEMINRIPQGVCIVARVISVHAETLAQKYGITAVYGVAQMRFDNGEEVWYIAEHKMADGTLISMDGHENQLLYHNSGKIFLGSVPVVERVSERIEVERRSPRALDRIRELREQEQWQEAMARRIGLSAFEREILVVFERFMKGEAGSGEIAPYLIRYRGILDKIARHCGDLDFELYGVEFKQALESRLAEWGISFELFMSLNRSYYPRGEKYRQILDRIIYRLNYQPPSTDLPDKVVVYDKYGQESTLRREGVRQ